MMDLVFKKFEWVEDPKDSIYPLFGFAVQDYMSECNLSPEAIKDFWVFGSILGESDNTDDFFVFMDKLRASGSIKMFVFDINYISKEFINKLIQQFVVGGQYRELENCYPDRIVFVFDTTT